ncbi:MAG: response regulator [Bacteroidales bacterium]
MVCNCRNALEAYQAIHLYAIDLVFLDISMPEVSGLSFARSVAGNTIIFTTAFREYVD